MSIELEVQGARVPAICELISVLPKCVNEEREKETRMKLSLLFSSDFR